MKLELTCLNDRCRYEFIEVVFVDNYIIGEWHRCPNCDMVHSFTIDIRTMGEYNEDKEDR